MGMVKAGDNRERAVAVAVVAVVAAAADEEDCGGNMTKVSVSGDVQFNLLFLLVWVGVSG